MLRSKKGMEAFPLILLLVVGCVTIIIMIALFVMVAQNARENAESTRCKTSVVAYARINSMPSVPFVDTGTADEAAIDCPTQYMTLDGDNQQMRKEIAGLMFRCWDNFGRGKIKLFKAENQKFCVICSVFQFDDKTTKLTGLPSYLMIEKAPVLLDGKKRVSYSEFFTGVQTNQQVIDQAKQSIDTDYFDGSQRYALMFTYYKKSYWSQIEGALVGGLIGLGGVLLGATIAAVTLGTGVGFSAIIITGAVATGAAIGASATGGGQGGGIATSGADWDANLVVAQYTQEGLKTFGCQSLPVSQVDAKFK
jgi:hypothetical protein